MAQHDYNLANQSGADFRADLNNALSAIVTVNSGATAPSTTFAHQLWVDTSSSVLKIRNSANDAWVTTGVSITADNTFTGNLTGNVTGNVIGDITGNADTATALETARTINGTSFDGTANISFDTDSVSEGSSNLYYTSARFDSAFSGKSTSDLTEGTNLYFTNARVESYLDAGTSTPTFASAVINTSLTGSAVLDDDTFGTASATTVATSESIKAYVDSQVGSVDTLSEILANGNTTGGTNIAFGDNDKAVFGTGSDLQIYHDGSNSRIREVGTGSLLLDAESLYLRNTTGDSYLQGINGGAVNIFYNGSVKLATTSSGIDIAGTTVTDGLTVQTTQGDIAIANSASSLNFTRAGTNYIRATDAAGHFKFITGANDFATQRLNIAANGDISFYDDTGSTQGLFWDASAESLGIGTTSPSEKLEVSDTQPTLRITDTAAGSLNTAIGSLEFYSEDTSGNYPAVGAAIKAITESSFGSGHGLALFTNADATSPSERVRISQDGSVGIGTVSPSQKLDVLGADTSGASITWKQGTRHSGYLYSDTSGVAIYDTNLNNAGIYLASNNRMDFRVNGSERMRIDSSGDVQIGTTASIASATLTTVSSGNTHQVMRSSNASAGEYWRQEVDASNDFYLIDNTSTGVYITDGSTSWSGISDENLKENIVELTGVLDKVKDFRCVEYNLIADEDSSKKIGFIAQDWQEDYSEVVSQDNDGNLGIKYTETIPVLLKAIQEQQTLIESLEARITTLEG